LITFVDIFFNYSHKSNQYHRRTPALENALNANLALNSDTYPNEFVGTFYFEEFYALKYYKLARA